MHLLLSLFSLRVVTAAICSCGGVGTQEASCHRRCSSCAKAQAGEVRGKVLFTALCHTDANTWSGKGGMEQNGRNIKRMQDSNLTSSNSSGTIEWGTRPGEHKGTFITTCTQWRGE